MPWHGEVSHTWPPDSLQPTESRVAATATELQRLCSLTDCGVVFAAGPCSKLVYVTALIREQGCLFIATNLDHADAISSSSGGGSYVDGTSAVERVMPGTGSLVAAVQVASGAVPVSLGCCYGGSTSTVTSDMQYVTQDNIQESQGAHSHSSLTGDKLSS
jgi:hypothetical protein